MNEDKIFDIITRSFLVIFFLFIIGAWPIKSYFEAKAFNKVTGKNVSTWDAMFIELRVQDKPNE